MNARRVIFHADMDAFYASVEQRDNPAYRQQPVIVGAKPGSRGVVSAASYEARKFGIRSAMPISEAYRRCPHGVYVRPRMSAYVRESRKVMGILRSFSPKIEPISVDEAFMDMTGTERLWGKPLGAAKAIAAKIRDELGLTVSIGIAPNMFLAKLASDLNKPAGITVTPFEPDAIIEWLAPMPVSRIWGVGLKTQAHLARLAITTIGDLQRLTPEQLENRFGKHGQDLFRLCRGMDERTVDVREERKSISREHTFPADTSDRELWRTTLLSLARDVASRARSKGRKGTTVVLTYRTPDFRRHSKRVTLREPTDIARRIYGEAVRILDELGSAVRTLRLIGVGITNLGDTTQTDLFSDMGQETLWKASENAMDSIADRYGDNAIFFGGEAEPPKRRKP